MDTFKWTQLRVIKQQKAVKMAILWVTLMPFIIKSFSFFGIVTILPYSVYSLYFGGLFLFLASILFNYKCPYYLNSGKSFQVIFPDDRSASCYLEDLQNSLNKLEYKQLKNSDSNYSHLILRNLKYIKNAQPDGVDPEKFKSIIENHDYQGVIFSEESSLSSIHYKTIFLLDTSRFFYRKIISILIILGFLLISISSIKSIYEVIVTYINVHL